MDKPLASNPTFSALKGEHLPNAIVFAACFGLLAFALALTPPHQGISDVRFGETYLPSVCTFYNLTGHTCPGCGLVRSVTAVAHGDLSASLAFHRMGWLVFIYILLQMVYRGVLLFVPAWRARAERAGKHLIYGLIVLAVMLMLNWLISFM